MPTILINDIDIYYEDQGDPANPPLLIIPGLGDPTAKCVWQSDALADGFRVIVLDNRGAGRSSNPAPGYTTALMADDAAALLDHLGITASNVFGFSLGGMVALNLALRRPDLVRRLALGCTTAGGDLAFSPDDRVMTTMVNPLSTGDRYRDYLDGVWLSCSQSFVDENPETIDRLAEITVRFPQTPEGYVGQLQAVLSHDVAADVGTLDLPVLVMHGDADVLIPLENGLALARGIPGAELIIYPGAGHLFFLEEAEAVNQALQKFFLNQAISPG